MLQRGWKIFLLYLMVLFFIYHGRKIAPVLYICRFTGTENNTRAFIYVTVDLYPFVYSNKLATILLSIYKQHVDGNRTVIVVKKNFLTDLNGPFPFILPSGGDFVNQPE